jgi:hypothetical protein
VGSKDIDDPSALVAKAGAIDEGFRVLNGVPAVAAHGTAPAAHDAVIGKVVALRDNAPGVAALGAGDFGAAHGM